MSKKNNIMWLAIQRYMLFNNMIIIINDYCYHILHYMLCFCNSLKQAIFFDLILLISHYSLLELYYIHASCNISIYCIFSNMPLSDRWKQCWGMISKILENPQVGFTFKGLGQCITGH